MCEGTPELRQQEPGITQITAASGGLMEAVSVSTPRRIRWVVLGGLLAGALDITYACIFWAVKAGLPAHRIFQSVASGLLGKASFGGGWATALLGLVLHFCIALSMAFTYYLVSLRWTPLRRRPLLFGPAYGLLLYGIMYYVVVPLSRAAGSRPGNDLWTWMTIAVHMFLIATPMALGTARAFHESRA